MKAKKLVLAVSLIALVFSSCKNDPEFTTRSYVSNFEDVVLVDSLGYWNGSDLKGEMKIDQESWGTITNYYGNFSSLIAGFQNIYSPDGRGSWKGFACSNHIDTETPGYENEYSVIAGSGAGGSEKFAIASSDGATINFPKDKFGFIVKSISMTNSTYAYLAMKEGNPPAKIFAEGDWFKVTVKGFRNEMEVGQIDYYLADFRDGRRHISNRWETVDFSSLDKEIDKLIFFFDSSDVGDYGMNNPAYVCIDNIVYEQRIELTVE